MSPKSTAAKQREIQSQVQEADRKDDKERSGAMQAGARIYSAPPFPTRSIRTSRGPRKIYLSLPCATHRFTAVRVS